MVSEAAALLSRRRTATRSQQSRRLRARLDHSPVAGSHDRGDGSGILAPVRGNDDAGKSTCITISDAVCERLFRQPERSDVSAPIRDSSGCYIYVSGTHSDAQPVSLPDADTTASDDLVWFEQPYWASLPVAGTDDGGNGDPDAAGLRDTDADVGLRVARQHLVDSRDRYGRERNLM
jgi:hypothetical protein